MRNNLYNASRFLLFAYFGLDFDTSKEEAIKKAINMAYKDATLMGAFNTTKDKSDNGKERKELVEKRLSEPIESFSNWHSTLCSDLEDQAKCFSYGNAQKLVNMTIKNMHIIYSVICEFKPDNEFVIYFKEKFIKYYKEFNIPVDDYILEAAWALEDENDRFENKKIKFPKRDKACKTKSGKYNSEKITRWSAWNEPQYYDFQASLKKTISNEVPLDWEYDAWIKIAKKRKGVK